MVMWKEIKEEENNKIDTKTKENSVEKCKRH